MTYRVAIVGGRGAHVTSYNEHSDCDVVAVANPTLASARRFADKHGIPGVYTDHVEMILEAEPHIVSVVTPEITHADIVLDIARTGIPEAIHCEKAMAHTFGGALRMTRACSSRDIQLTIHHQYRFKPGFREASDAIQDGYIGNVTQVSYGFPDLFTHGTHSIDLCGMYNDERPAEWVIGQIDYRTENIHRGTHNENQAFGMWAYDNGVFGIGSTQLGQSFVDEAGATEDIAVPYSIHNRIDGTNGTLLVVQEHRADGPKFVLIGRQRGNTWEQLPVSETNHSDRLAINDVISGLTGTHQSELCADNALKTTEILFGVWESSRRRGRIDLPLDITDNPIEEMVDHGMLTPDPSADT